jgi:hypothetical protein
MGPLVIRGSRAHTVSQPDECSRWLMRGGGGVNGVHVDVLDRGRNMIHFQLVFDPPPTWALPGFPHETVQVLVAGWSDPVAVPSGPERKWLHRYPTVPPLKIILAKVGAYPLPFLVGGLCLWYPNDPLEFRWCWDKGFHDFVLILQRHLWLEEFWRRTGIWPSEDAPHGHRFDGKPHPIMTEGLRRAS